VWHAIYINTMRRKYLHIILVILMAPFSASRALADEYQDLLDLLRIAEKGTEERLPDERIYLKKNLVYCTGTSRAAEINNRAADLLQNGKYSEAVTLLESAMSSAALFFPFRYNAGMSYLYLNDLPRAMLNFQKASGVLPEFSGTYLQIGYIYQRQHRDSMAIKYFREALKRNRQEISTFIRIGDIFFARNQLEMASQYYEASLRLRHRYPDGLLGMAKIQFRREKYIRAMVLLKSIDTSGEYDKSLHYYFAESAFRLRDYKTAVKHYETLLRFKNDRFFLTNATSLIEHKLNLSRRFTER